MKAKFSETDLGCLIGDEWGLFGNRIRREKDGLHLVENGEHDSCWFHPEPENPVLPFPFTLEQFRAFCDWHPTFQWEAIESVFTNDDGSLDDAAIERLNPASSAADLVRAILAGPDSEFLEAWEVWEKVDECKAEIEEMQRARKNAKTPTEVIAAKQELERLHDDLATLLTQATGATPVPPQQPEPHPTEQEASAPASVEQVEPVTRSAAQGAVILETIRRVGHEPLSLPKNEAGKRGIKAVVRGELVAKHKLFPKDGRQFDKAWERLRAFKEIADGD